VCQLVIGVMGNPSNEAFVNTVYQNVVGVPPSAEVRDFYVGLLQGSGGTMTQADLLQLAANDDANAVHINLVGLQETGVEFV
jgi:serralysin